ncbi:hypothetical protein [Marisediminicola senii]|uniref:hypothetical protein n=1 Tax=Marisediminicola senii TaxID=2711233 RepID=UPI0013EBBDED|nr:hypothetical protein [Marisediminicola senii]
MSPEQSIVDRGMNESYEALLASSEFAAERATWAACVERGGLSLDPDARVMVPQFPAAGEEQLRVAAVDVECKETSGVTQAVADMEAALQSRYIDANEGELDAYRETADEVTSRAQDLLTTVVDG